MINYSTANSNLKRGICNYSKKISKGLKRPEMKFACDMTEPQSIKQTKKLKKRFKLDWRQKVISRMRTIEIVEMNILKNRQFDILNRMIRITIYFFKFEKFEKGFCHSVVIRMSLFRKRLNKSCFIKSFSEFITCVLRTSVRMKNYILRIVPIFQC